MNLTEQQHHVIRYLPQAIEWFKGHAISGNEASAIVADRLESGDRVFGDRMFRWEAGDLWDEAMEELADALLYYCAYLYVSDHGPVQDD